MSLSLCMWWVGPEASPNIFWMLEIFIPFCVDNVVSFHANSFKWKEKKCHNQTQESNNQEYFMVSKL